jgi:hypothetical protein
MGERVLSTLRAMPPGDVHIADLRAKLGASQELDRALIDLSRDDKVSLWKSEFSGSAFHPDRAKFASGSLWHPGRQEYVHYVRLRGR